MGRVRRYKKFKAIDPFAKAKKAEVDLVHDEPPDVHDERGSKAGRNHVHALKSSCPLLMPGRKRRRQLEEVDEDVMLRREGMRALREEKARQV